MVLRHWKPNILVDTGAGTFAEILGTGLVIAE